LTAALVFLTPRWALLALGGAVPLAALALAARRGNHARAVLRLSAPPRSGRARRPIAVVAVAALLGVAASQPVLRSASTVDVRTDAEALFVIDNSRSMLAARAPGARTRIARARDDAVRLRDELGDIAAGVATLTDNVIPDLLPVPGRDTFDETVRGAVRVGNPPAATDAVTATTLAALGAVATQNFFPTAAKHRVVIVLTDGESRPFDVRQTARALAHAPRVTPIFVHVSAPGEAVYDGNGKPETAYHPDPSSTASLAALAQASGGTVFGEGDLARAAKAARAALGRGPTVPEGTALKTVALGPYFALAAIVPLLLLLGGAYAFRGRGLERSGPVDRLGRHQRPADLELDLGM
jgi:hypothetical protein